MIDDICSIRLLTRCFIDISDELKYIFEECKDFLGGNLYIYKIINKNKNAIIITNISKEELNIYDEIEFLNITNNIQIEINNQINNWRSKTIYIRKNYDEDYDNINFFNIFPSINDFGLKFYFDFNHNKFMFTDKKSGPHFTKKELDNIIKTIKWKNDPFSQTPMIEPPIDILY